MGAFAVERDDRNQRLLNSADADAIAEELVASGGGVRGDGGGIDLTPVRRPYICGLVGAEVWPRLKMRVHVLRIVVYVMPMRTLFRVEERALYFVPWSV